MRTIHGRHVGGLAAADRLARGGVNHPEIAIERRGIRRQKGRHVDVKRNACLGVLEQPEVRFQVLVERLRQQHPIFELAVKCRPERAR